MRRSLTYKEKGELNSGALPESAAKPVEKPHRSNSPLQRLILSGYGEAAIFRGFAPRPH